MALPTPAGITGTKTAGVSNVDGALKQIYRPSNVKKLTYDMRPMFAMMPKFEGFGGRNMPVVVKWGHPMGRSIDFQTAQDVATEYKVDDFLLTRVSDYAVNYIDGDELEATRGDSYAFLKALSEVIDGTLEVLADSIETKIFRQGTGTFAQIGGTPTAANPMVVTLKQIEEITNVEFNMQLVACATDGGTARAAPAQAVVAGVDRTTGEVTTDYDNSGPTTDWAADDFLACKGDLAAAAGGLKAMAGLAAWAPPAAATSTAFFSVDRTSDSRLSGLRHDATGGGKLEDHFIKAQSIAAREGGKPDILAMHHAQLRRLNIELGAKKVYAEVNSRDKKGIDASISFRAIVIEGDHGPISVVPCNKCQAKTGWMLTIKDWLLSTLGPPTKIIVDDGLRMLRMADQDAFEVRARFRGNVSTKSPIRNVNIALPDPV